MPYTPLLSPWQCVQARKLLADGVPPVAVARKFGVSEQLLYYYRKKWSK